LAGERVGLVAFAGNAQVISPLTTDLDYLRLALSNVNSRSIPVQGTDLGGALNVAHRALAEGSEEGSGDPEVSVNQSSRTLLLLSDGEDHEDAALKSARELAQDGVRVLVVGLGTAEGGPIPVRDEQGQTRGQKRDRRGEIVVSRFRLNPDIAGEIG
jgi:Ca-activated chloride channel family protein